jgi:serine protease Do
MRIRLTCAMACLLAMPLVAAPAFARTMESNDVSVAEKATPAVVNIGTWKVRNSAEGPRRIRAYGSGFIVDPSGFIVTNKHVIDGAFDISVIFSDGTRVPAKLAAVAAMIDLAVLKIEVDHPLPYLKWADSRKAQVGDSVLTIGNPLGLGVSVSAGIISGLNRDIQDTPFDDYIQTDSGINHGNSGGPMVNEDAEVVGVDTALYNPDENGGFIGIGFAIPSNTASFVVKRLLDPNHPKPGWLGLTLQDLTPELADALGIHGVKGAIISAVDATGPAAQAALRPGDVVAAINDRAQTDSRAYMRTIVGMLVGQPATLTIWRGGHQQVVKTTVREWPNFMPNGGVMNARMAEAMIQKMPDPGVRLAPLTDAARAQYGLDSKVTGVLIAAVEADCEARDLGIVAGDVIAGAQGAPVTKPSDVRDAIQQAHQQRRPYIAFLIQSKANTRWVTLSIGGAGS